MDTTRAITHLGLCAGYCGIELGLKRVLPALRTVALCEIEAFACANLVAKMEEGFLDPAPIWTDLKSFPWADFRGKVDLLTGGYPCQPFSAAGNRLGKDDPRHLWPFIADGIRLLQPRVCFFENVEGHISLGLREVVEELEGLGYKTTWGIFSASEVGAPHQRKRVFIMAYRNDSGRGQDWVSAKFWSGVSQQSSGDCRVAHAFAGQQIWPSQPGENQFNWEPPRVVANAKNKQNRGKQLTGVSTDITSTSDPMGNTTRQRLHRGTQDGLGLQSEVPRTGYEAMADTKGGDGQRSTPRESGYVAQPDEDPIERQTEPTLGRDIDECPDRMDDAELHVTCDNRTDELRLLGNGVVPATAERAFCVLIGQILNKKSPL